MESLDQHGVNLGGDNTDIFIAFCKAGIFKSRGVGAGTQFDAVLIAEMGKPFGLVKYTNTFITVAPFIIYFLGTGISIRRSTTLL